MIMMKMLMLLNVGDDDDDGDEDSCNLPSRWPDTRVWGGCWALPAKNRGVLAGHDEEEDDDVDDVGDVDDADDDPKF